MIGFTRLRLKGFKSFADQVDLEIAPGLTGIVGPNGCGKSNILEALRWVMGESSAKKMRGGEMEDVIFAGTSSRPARDIAQVVLTLDNTAHTAPAPWTTTETIEIGRSIARGQGSAFRINGRPMRSRDVHILFADGGSGAASPALVSQGHIARMMTVKPQERRQILEEAAGIAGLHARRAEAAQRLTAAKTNLTHVVQRLAEMQMRLEALMRAARQSARYRRLSENIRELERAIAAASWQDIAQRLVAAKQERALCESALSELSHEAEQKAKAEEEAEKRIRALRLQETMAAGEVERIKAQNVSLETAAARHTQDCTAAKALLEQICADMIEEEKALNDAQARLLILEQEEATQGGAQNEQETLCAQQEELVTLEDAEKKANAAHESAVSIAALARAEYGALVRRLAEGERQKESVQKRLDAAQEAWDTLCATDNLHDDKEIQDCESAIETLSLALKDVEAKTPALEERIKVLIQEEQEADVRATQAERKAMAVSCEIAALEPLVTERSAHATYKDAVVHALDVEMGTEKALAAALGDGLSASLDPLALTFWSTQEEEQKIPAPPLPSEARALLDCVHNAPPALTLALCAAGIVSSMQEAENLAPFLRPGQCLVTKEGGICRWDGYRAQDGAQEMAGTNHATRLIQKSRLLDLRTQELRCIQDQKETKEQLIVAQTALQEAKSAHVALMAARTRAERDISAQRLVLSEIREAVLHKEGQKARIQASLDEALASLVGTQDSIANDTIALSTLKMQQAEAEDSLQNTQREAESARMRTRAAQDIVNAAAQALAGRNARARALADERVNLRNQAIRARGRIETLSVRKEDQGRALAALEQKSCDETQTRKEILAALNTAQDRYFAAQKVLEEEEQTARTMMQTFKAREEDVALLRERRAVAAADHTRFLEQRTELARTIESKFGSTPESLLSCLSLDKREETSPLESLDRQAMTLRLGTLSRQREGLGPVNLQAEEEAKVLTQERDLLAHEEEDLTKATQELETAIRNLNRQARGRLLAAFKEVDAHFQTLFVRLFGGGQARLTLTSGQDPLEAGLEVLAQPPGKTLQSLTLLSGGEQTMASIALIMAMFLTAPAPLCVLDEIDAALDDANVERMCNLLDEIAARAQTRFLVITHHRLTMARMNRLYGVTMAERGVSALVSVDLQDSFVFLDTP